MTESEQKAAFAAFLLLNPKEPLAAATMLFPSEQDTGKACYISMNWPSDPEVIAHMADKARESLSGPSKDDVVREMWDLAKDVRYNGKDRVAAARIVAEIKGFITKDGSDDGAKKVMPSAPVYRIVSE